MADPHVQTNLRRENETLKRQVERKNYEEVLKIFDVHEERKQFAVSLAQELLRVNVGSKKHIERIRGWATRSDRAARVADKRAKKREHDMKTETLDPSTATRDPAIVAKICATDRLKALTKK